MTAPGVAFAPNFSSASVCVEIWMALPAIINPLISPCFPANPAMVACLSIKPSGCCGLAFYSSQGSINDTNKQIEQIFVLLD